MPDITFQKTGTDIKKAIQIRIGEINQRLAAREETLKIFMKNPLKVRSFLIRNAQPSYGHGRTSSVLVGKNDISSEEKEEISQLCQRIFELEQEIYRLSLAFKHLEDSQVCNLTLDELAGYGFSS